MMFKTWNCHACGAELGKIVDTNLVITSVGDDSHIQRISTNGANIVFHCNCGTLKTWYPPRSALLDQLFIEAIRLTIQKGTRNAETSEAKSAS
jgi:enamine deaminase RidA (YjgF/YER057c/UK114 family)